MAVDLDQFETQSDRLKADDLVGWGWAGLTYTISNVDTKTYPANPEQNRAEETKLRVWLRELEDEGKALECNKTQIASFKEFLGKNTDEWIGKQIVLNIGKVNNPSTGKMVNTIVVTEYKPAPVGGVLPPKKGAPAQPKPGTAPAEPEDPFANQ